MRKLLLGNEAIAFGAINAGVQVVTGYPGTPSTEVLETISKNNTGDIYVEWSVNEKVALEVAAGASYAGARTLVTMKQVGLNVAADPLMCLSYIGVKGGMVVLAADDPGPASSQTEQDTRHFARFSNLPVFDPSSPEEAYDMMKTAFEISERFELPVLFRPTTRICHSCAAVDVPVLSEYRNVNKNPGFEKDSRWVIFPNLSYKKHIHIEQLQDEISNVFSCLKYNEVTGKGKKGIVASGIAYSYVREFIASLKCDIKILKIATPYPFPKKLALEFIDGLDELLVIEELDPVIEESLLELAAKYGEKIVIYGKKTRHLPYAGEYSYKIVKSAIEKFLGIDGNIDQCVIPIPKLPVRPPVLCAGCPHRASFYAVKCAIRKEKAVFTGDIGCYTLGNAKPLEMIDTCLCMGAGITIAQGLQRVEPDVKHIAFIGDSTFFHSGLPGIINAVYNKADITIAVLDNNTTAMTGHQPHPGTGKTVMNDTTEKIDIYKLLAACGIKHISKVNPFEHKNAVEAVRSAVDFTGPSAIIFQAPCIAVAKPSNKQRIKENCLCCKKCIKEIGCPALRISNGKVIIENSLCQGCRLCSQVCNAGAIGGAEE